MNKRITFPPRSAAALLIAAFPLFAQSGQVFSGGVQQNADGSSNLQVQTIVLDIYHQLSIMWGNPSASQQAQSAFQDDVNRFNGYVSLGNSFAAQLAPCVRLYQRAFPHVVQQSRYYTQNNSSAFNSKGAIANPLIKAGANCVSQMIGDQFASNGNTYSRAPTPQVPAPIYQYPYYGNPQSAVPSAPPLQGGVQTDARIFYGVGHSGKSRAIPGNSSGMIILCVCWIV